MADQGLLLVLREDPWPTERPGSSQNAGGDRGPQALQVEAELRGVSQTLPGQGAVGKGLYLGHIFQSQTGRDGVQLREAARSQFSAACTHTVPFRKARRPKPIAVSSADHQ